LNIAIASLGGQWLLPNLNFAGSTDALPSGAQRILIDCDDFAVLEDCRNLRAHVADVISGDKRRSDHCPENEMGPVLIRRHAPIANFEHVGIIPVPGPAKSARSD